MVESPPVNGNATWRTGYHLDAVTLRGCVLAAVILLGAMLCSFLARARGNGAQEEHVTTVRGHVLNWVTNQPVGHALVVMQSNNAATFTDDFGQFELKISETQQTGGGPTVTTFMASSGGPIEARKPGFLQADRMQPIAFAQGSTTKDPPEVTIRLVPEALIVGHVEVPGSEGEVRIDCQLYRHEMYEGHETWTAQRSFQTWANGEFRFSGLKAGTYKLITHEQMDRDSMSGIPGAQLYGFPPVYYQNTTDFSAAAPIVVKAGETARVNLTVTRREYYPVNITVANVPPGLRLELNVYPMGHQSPGWSLGYNPAEEAIVGILPDGNYTVEGNAQGAPVTGILNFSVKGRPLEGPTLNLVPDATVTVKVREEFQSGVSNWVASETATGNTPTVQRHIWNVHMALVPIEDLSAFRRYARQEAEGSQGQELTFSNVKPGQYQLIVNSGIGYAASMQSGGKDLLQQPLVVGLGGSVAPIEIVLRDDGAEVDGTLEGESINPATIAAEADTLRSNHLVYLLPVKEGGHPLTTTAWQGTFRFAQVPPGDYLAVAFEQQLPEDIPYGSTELMKSLSSKGQMIHLEAGQKLTVKLKLVAGDGE